MKLVTLNIQINAWLDCSHPFISLHNKSDGDLMAYFNTEKINSLINSGDITVEELKSNNPDKQEDTITTLLSMKQQEAILKRLQDTRFTFNLREPNNDGNSDKNVSSIENKKPSQDILFPLLGLNTA